MHEVLGRTRGGGSAGCLLARPTGRRQSLAEPDPADRIAELGRYREPDHLAHLGPRTLESPCVIRHGGRWLVAGWALAARLGRGDERHVGPAPHQPRRRARQRHPDVPGRTPGRARAGLAGRPLIRHRSGRQELPRDGRLARADADLAALPGRPPLQPPRRNRRRDEREPRCLSPVRRVDALRRRNASLGGRTGGLVA